MPDKLEANLFIHPENQTMLWNLLQESPYIVGFNRSIGGIDNVMEWFRSVMSSAYQLNPEVTTIDRLKKINAEVITICSKHMKAHVTYDNNQENELYDTKKQKELRIAEAKANFDAFREAYDVGLTKPSPPNLNLSINLDEPKITNMEELVKQHIESRNSLQLPVWDKLENQEYSSLQI